ncbi:hypothetical protein [Sulfurovum mangrovi]|uniref:hypothetical protein n=1 Tax=Sulfurovum mangrovi TaxID=2893889 RepID=UPI001E5C2A65|nr:hypothetical protein [Sulfurovum mangrovi]UFH59202.1 hypothetical protein LN246_12795 [Sulfurovum mangrovi]
MRSNDIKPVEEIEEATACECGMVEPERKVYHTPELVELGEKMPGADSLPEDEC